MRLLRSSLVGGSAPKPPGFFRFFQARISILVSVEGDRLRLSPTIPATEPVARVASQQRSIPSASAWLIINYVVRALYKKPANGHSPLNFVSHVLGSPHRRKRPPSRQQTNSPSVHGSQNQSFQVERRSRLDKWLVAAAAKS